MIKKIGNFSFDELIFPMFKIFLSGLVAAFALYIPIKVLDQLVFDTTRTFNLMVLTGISTFCGMAVYLFIAWFLDVPQIAVIFKIFQRLKPKEKGILLDTPQEVVNLQEN